MAETIRRRACAAPALVLALGGCVLVPQTRQVYDHDCQAVRREMTLEVAVLASFHSCKGDACAAMLATAGVVTAASAVISGSIVVVGNMVYWFERRGGCARPAA